MEATTNKKRSIYVLEGTYRNRKIENTSFDLVKCYQPYPHKEGGFVTVKIKDLEQKWRSHSPNRDYPKARTFQSGSAGF